MFSCHDDVLMRMCDKVTNFYFPKLCLYIIQFMCSAEALFSYLRVKSPAS